MWMTRLLAAVIAGLAGIGLASSGNGQGAQVLAPGSHRVDLRSDGRLRSYIVYVPPQARAGGNLPLVLNFHGGGSNAAQQQRYSQMDELARREGFVVAYPDGTGRLSRRLTWNAGDCCGYAHEHAVDDVAFALEVIDDVSRRTKVDTHRIYASGMSNGAMMAYRLAAEASGTIAAIAPVAGGMVTDSTPTQPVSVMHFHSVDDPRAIYEGGLGPPHLGTGMRVAHPNIERVMSTWARYDGCSSPPTARQTKASDGHTATKIAYDRCRRGSEVVLWRLTGAGHVWPGGRQDVPRRLLGPATTVVDANAEMWRFFERHRRRT